MNISAAVISLFDSHSCFYLNLRMCPKQIGREFHPEIVLWPCIVIEYLEMAGSIWLFFPGPLLEAMQAFFLSAGGDGSWSLPLLLAGICLHYAYQNHCCALLNQYNWQDVNCCHSWTTISFLLSSAECVGSCAVSWRRRSCVIVDQIKRPRSACL